jgi:hypothetical protein
VHVLFYRFLHTKWCWWHFFLAFLQPTDIAWHSQCLIMMLCCLWKLCTSCSLQHRLSFWSFLLFSLCFTMAFYITSY